ncbi:MAG: adenylyltransferase/cytidyltransferase family protein [Patescibacteria group bacterium]
MRKIMVFGSFDGFHGGHELFLRDAKKLGDYLIAVVAQDHVVRHLRGADPGANLAERFDELAKVDAVDEVAVGDFELATWRTIERYHPDVVAFGKDQTMLAEDLQNHLEKLTYQPTLITLNSFEVNRL